MKQKNASVPAVVSSVVPRLFRVPQAAHYLGATNWFVEEMFRSGEFPFLTLGKYRVVDVRDLDAWIDAEKEAQAVQASKAAA